MNTMRAKDGREAAVLVLLSYEKGESPKEAESAVLAASSLSRADISFLTELVNGTLERMLTIDFCIGKFSKTPVKKLKPLIRADLRVAVYQLLFLTKVPESAAVNEAVKIAVSHGLSGLKGFVNGVLRNIAKNKEALLTEIAASEDPEVRYSLPAFVYESLAADYGKQKAESIAEAFFERKPLYALSLTKTTDEKTRGGKGENLSDGTVTGLEQQDAFADLLTSLQAQGYDAVADEEVPGAFYIDGPAGGITETTEFKAGAFYIMDRASMEDGLALMQALPDLPKTCLRLLDLCAAPGGKSIHAAQILQNAGTAGAGTVPAADDKSAQTEGLVPAADEKSAQTEGTVPEGNAAIISRDVSESKVSRIRENAVRCGFSNIKAEVGDATVFAPADENAYDVVIADVPCSGFGVIGNKPDIRYRHTAETMESLLSLQKKILANAVRYVKAGGCLIFSTCTLHKAENEEKRKAIEDAGFACVSEKTSFPDEGKGGGFYTSLLQKK